MDLRNEGRRDGRSWKLPDVITKAGAVGRSERQYTVIVGAALCRERAAQQPRQFLLLRRHPGAALRPYRDARPLPQSTRSTEVSVQTLAANQLGQFGGIRALDNTPLGHDNVNQVGRGHVEHRVEYLHIPYRRGTAKV